MKNFVTRTAIAAVVVTVGSAASMAHANTVDVKFLGTSKGSNVKIVTPGGTSNVFAGQLRHQINNGTGLGAMFNGTYVTYCSDANQFVSGTTKQFNIVPVQDVPGTTPMGVAKANALTNLYTFASGNHILSTVSNDYAAAFQLAVWEIIYDFNANVGLSSLDIATGAFSAKNTNNSALSSSIANQVNTFLDGVFNLPEGAPAAELAGITHATAQDQIVQVPSPGAIALAGLGGLMFAKRRRGM